MNKEIDRWQTNKALFKRIGNIIEKSYFRSGETEKDYRLLDSISKSFPETHINGWVYRSLKVYPPKDYDCGRSILTMEYIDAPNLKFLFENIQDPVFFYHAGCWLGLLHQSTKDENGTVLTFNDYNRSNVIVDKNSKTVLAIDPGGYSQLRGHPSISVFMMGFSLVIGAVRESVKYIFPSAVAFFRGYAAVGADMKISLRPGARYLMYRFQKGQSRALVARPKVARLLTGIMETVAIFTILSMARWKCTYLDQTEK